MQVIHVGEAGAEPGPLVTYHIQCYRHEAFVEESVRSVLAQTYRPLEVLISDDGSPDRIFEIAASIAHDYTGPHRVVLYRSPQNRDILEHCNAVLPLIHGQFFVWLSGDDVAEHNQVQELVSAWVATGVCCVWSNYRGIDQHGLDCGPGLASSHPYTLDLCDYATGAFLDFPYSGTCGYSREVLDRFGPVPAHLGSRGLEHHFGFRAALLGPKRYLPEMLVRKRTHPCQATAGLNGMDRGEDQMVVHERQIRVRLQVLTGCLDSIVDLQGVPHDPAHASIALALRLQIANESRRLLEFEAFRARNRRFASSGRLPAEHSGSIYPPNQITLVRALPEYQHNLIAGECKFFAAPWSLGHLAPCGLRNHASPGVISAWSEAEILAELRRTLDGNMAAHATIGV